MTNILVGDPGCPFQEIALIFEEPSVGTLEITWWRTLAMHLRIPRNYVIRWQQDLLLDKLAHVDVILDILTQWRAINSNNATLGTLYDTIPKKVKELKDLLQAKIRQKAISWNYLDTDSQKVILQTEVEFLGRKYTLSAIRDMMNTDMFYKIMQKEEMKELFTKSFKKESWNLGRYEIPKLVPYYIQRTFIFKRKLNPAIFNHKCSDIFVIQGIKRHHLTILAKPELTEVSSEQLNKVTRRFILLEHPDDYKEIIKIAIFPVHRIRHDDNQFFWLSTSGSSQIIREYLTSDIEEIDETSLLKEHLSIFNNRPIAICSSPGMGKSVLLAHLAYEMNELYPERILIFLEFWLLIPMLSSYGPETDAENLKQILVSCSSLNPTGKEFFVEILKNKELIFEVFLDGFDEISLEYLKQAQLFLEHLLSCPNIRVYITSRPHMKNEIENTFEVISFDLAPFNQNNQVHLLCGLWSMDQNIADRKKLSEFALNVLRSFEFLNQGMTSQTEFAGIPLQCFMLAQVYTNPAKMYCNRDQFNFKITTSLYDLYDNFVYAKFTKIKECARKLIKLYHWREALMLLFPKNHEVCQIVAQLTKLIGTKGVSLETILKVGILEQTKDKFNFVHRTFAEYLVAEFIFEELLTKETLDLNVSVKFIIDSALLAHGTTKGQMLCVGDIIRIRDFIESREYWLSNKLDLKELKAALIKHCSFPLETVTDNLYQILINWFGGAGFTVSTDMLDRTLKILDCGQLVDDLHKNVYPVDIILEHGIMCTFLDAKLKKNESSFSIREFGNCVYENTLLSQNRGHLKLKIVACTKLGHQFLTQTLVKIYHETSIFKNELEMDQETCAFLLCFASFNENLDLFKFTCDTVKSFQRLDLKNFFKNFQLGVDSPLLRSISKGNYRLVEYLVHNYVDEDVKQLNEVWLACFYNSWKDSPNILKSKVEILHLLKSLHQNIQIEELEKNFPNGVSVELLTKLYDMCSYIPSEKDVQFITMCVLFCCKDDTEMDYLVNWLFSKNLPNLLTHMYKRDSCLLDHALLTSVLKPETLVKVYTEYNFDLGKILKCSVLCKRSDVIVRTIIELSGEVNLVDDNKSTLLHWAASFRRINAIKYLLAVGANVNMRNAFGCTPLYNVFQQGSSENFHLIHDATSLLVTNKANVSAKNIAGISALQLAMAHQDDICVEERTLMMLKNAEHPDSMEDASLELFTDAKEAFTDRNFFPLLAILQESFVCKRFLAFVQNMVEISGNVNISNCSNTTLLHYAALHGDKEAIEFLLVNGAETNVKDIRGCTPLHYIFDWNQRNYVKYLRRFNENTNWIHECVELLLKYDASPSILNQEGITSLNMARIYREKLRIENRTIILLERKSDDNTINLTDIFLSYILQNL